ncbi:hypothetical protein BBW65_05000 [Helicobacter enhydrae]|uniref:Uncharacterized protein n=1 Tax=Helicobacter enhydrae TaxID=222136 RepID=A0A1B1U5W6_9HELI|nr:hypothetical protein [Helicobacter enhydrae]ANV98194.1 hypothetical protein BBW65_05000 [Helicobacter enhydrae]
MKKSLCLCILVTLWLSGCVQEKTTATSLPPTSQQDSNAVELKFEDIPNVPQQEQVILIH